MMIPCAIIFLLGFTASIVSSQSNGETNSHAKVIEQRRLPKTTEAENMTQILQSIFEGYDKAKRPYFGAGPVNVTQLLGVISVSHISEENMEFKADVYFRQIWDDPRLAFGTVDQSILLQHEEVHKPWVPDTYIENTRKIEIDESTPTIIIYGSGRIFYSYKAIMTLSSQMHFERYPMDRQGLKFSILSYAYDESKLILKWQDSTFMQQEMAGFTLETQTFTTRKKTFLTGTYIELVLTVYIKRRLGYFMLQFYFPCIICTVIAWVPFYMDRYAIGDRMSLAITTLLTEVFLSDNINSSMPRVNYIKASDMFTLVSFIFIFLSLLENLIVYSVRDDVRKKTSTNQLFKENGSNINEEAEGNSVPQGETTSTGAKNHARNEEARIEVKQLDLSLCVDRFSRVCFPLSYAIFGLVYWLKGL